jgi:hypothetical protein
LNVNARAALAVLLFATQVPVALACGYCVEDKLAATYDHRVVTRAMERGRAMVFMEVAGMERAEHGFAPALVATVEAVPGVNRGTVRISAAPAAVSFSFDADRYAVASAVSEINRKLASQKITLIVLRIVDFRHTVTMK